MVTFMVREVSRKARTFQIFFTVCHTCLKVVTNLKFVGGKQLFCIIVIKIAIPVNEIITGFRNMAINTMPLLHKWV